MQKSKLIFFLFFFLFFSFFFLFLFALWKIKGKEIEEKFQFSDWNWIWKPPHALYEIFHLFESIIIIIINFIIILNF